MDTPALYLRRARPTDLDTIAGWRSETAAWLAERHGTDQWSTEYPRELLERWVDRGETFMVALAPTGEPIGTITSSSSGDPELWTPDELAMSARYVAQVNVVRTHAGQDIGATLLRWARHDAAEAGATVVRADIWTSNERLRAFYRDLGFRVVRVVPGRGSGALVEALAMRSAGAALVHVEDEA